MSAASVTRLRVVRTGDPASPTFVPVRRRPAASTLDVPDWRLSAACLDGDLNLFFPVSTVGAAVQQQVAAAKLVCDSCPVQSQCLEWSLAVGPEFGIFGGCTEHERRVLRNERGNGPRWSTAAGPHRSETAVHEALEPF